MSDNAGEGGGGLSPAVAAEAAGRNLLAARRVFARAWRRYWAAVEPCSDETGFRRLAEFRTHLDTYRFKLDRPDVGVSQAASELFRLVAVGPEPARAAGFAELRAFAKWYAAATDRIGLATRDLFDFHGDTVNDLIDSLPLAGEAVVRRLLAKPTDSSKKPFTSEEELRKAVARHAREDATNLGHAPGWIAFILEGENYVRSALADQARKWWLYELDRATERDAGGHPAADEDDGDGEID